ncbi:Asp-tRNA(Asn)/Glu-tRNA(Gln) amidotransferase subunit GatB [Luteolibacter pohnpeiensis]|uniref:Aspartyl/glutamyl-tRNA(Asn/Gln) amidotransferase subunit B n=1 Tax=Luteolibacter pohnpeiensis TaxID=454153 RepID=A0A934S8B2_9BACT|nr:Asp-tRNA(Asn)/Glu-tRNA(Gln) amidotransferase subunit GatB [Luteolibacter pohnpeiensis]MBK1881214.1 Asp-tRNA(Asn)/Glu-tRNA(Gln) amidotransferase subunit GatB [Luteolibacter pohnpeiensis]
MKYLVTIGLEVHAQVKTNTKMFCACETSFGDEPNTHNCPVCLGLPGALPVLNRAAIEQTLLTGLMLGCGSPPISKWDRKNYFYPDMPKNYQTTQMDLPLCIGGGVPLYEHCYPTDHRKNIANPGKVVRLNRIHLEEDVAKSTHLGSSSLIDFNRAGTPLMEIVSEPDLESAEEAFAYLRSLQMILQQGEVSDADMEKGQLRCDVNISLREKEEDPLGAKVELKNLNSISAIRRAIHFEIDRQTEELNMGIPQIQSTRRWDDERGETQMMRTKEDAHDYRYFTCPDLLPIETAPLLEIVRPKVPELPHELAARFENDLGVTAYDASVLSSDRNLSALFQRLAAGASNPKKAANFLINNYLGSLNAKGLSIETSPISAANLEKIAQLTLSETLSAGQSMEVLGVMLEQPEKEPQQIADEFGFKPADAGELESLVDQVIAENPNEVEAIKGGNEKLLNFLTGKVMKAAPTKPNPKQVTELLRAKLC